MHHFLLNYSEAFGRGDKEAVPRLFALDDPRFSVFQDTMAGLVGAKEMLEVADRFPTLSEPRLDLEEVKVEMLRDATLVTGFQLVRVTSQEERRQTHTRLTMPLIRKGRDWRILHAHFSALTGT